ncbi:MAG: YlbF family regulator [Gemmatimonadota bacterium]|nr:YlbF family regulator [Gemmatimonadota bacterium]MDH5759373.1 YlbF family regulator [Gemmatimonadota bacterium]
MAGIYEMAKELGGALARTDEYQALRRAGQAVDEDRESVELRNRLREMEGQLEAAFRSGQQPSEELAQEFEAAAQELQTRPVFQQFIVAQTNFEKVMHKVNQTVAQGIQEGAASRIIISS